MILQYILVLVLPILYFIDFKLALKIAKKDLLTFEKIEQNKALVYAVMKDIIEKSNRNIILLHVNSVVSWVIGAILFGCLGLIFNIQFEVGLTLFLMSQSAMHVIGIASDVYGIKKVKPRPNVNQQAGVKVPSYAG